MELGTCLDLAKLFLTQNKFNEAQDLISKVITLSGQKYNLSSNPWRIQAEHLAGRIWIAQNKLNLAAAKADTIKKLVEKYKNKPIYLDYYKMLLAEINLKKSELDKAFENLDRTSQTIKDHSPYYNSLLAKCYTVQGKTQEAINIYQDFYTDVTSGWAIWGGDFYDYYFERSLINYKIALINDRQGDSENALTYYNKALMQWREADPGLTEMNAIKSRMSEIRKN